MLNPNNLLLYLASEENVLGRLFAARPDCLVLLLSPSPVSSDEAVPARRLLRSNSIADTAEDGDDDKVFVEGLVAGSLKASIA